MKISMIGPVTPYRGGIAHFTTMLAKKLIQAGHEVQVISFKKQFPAWLYPGKTDKDYSPGREKVDADFLLTPLNPLSWHKSLKAIIAFHPNQVILPWWVTFWAPAFRHIITRLKKAGFPVTILIHNTMPHEARLLDRILARRTLQSADRYIVMTHKEKDRLLTLVPDAKNIAITSLPIYNSFKRTELSRRAVREQLGLPLDKPIALFFGFIRPYKGLNVLIDAHKVLVDRDIHIDLLIVGEFWENKSNYISKIKALNLSERVHVVDTYIPDDEVSAYFEASNVFVAPYIDGTQSAALKTALGFGLPAVVTDVIKDKMVVALTDRCKIVPAGNAAALANGIEAQLQMPIYTGEQTENLVNRSWQDMLAIIGKNWEQTSKHIVPKEEKETGSR